MRGEVGPSGRPTGGHSRPGGVDPPDRRMGRRGPDRPTGGYDGFEIGYRRPDGRWTSRQASTFFPDAWTEDDVREAVREAWNDPGGRRRPDVRRWSGTARGLAIGGYFEPSTGECRTAFPVEPEED